MGASDSAPTTSPGTDDADELFFTFNDGTERYLRTWDASSVEGYIRGNERADRIDGSDVAETPCDDNLFGQHGQDLIYGLNGIDSSRAATRTTP